jgi:hypothetical protein
MIFALALMLAVQEPVRVELNHDQYSSGDKARVYVRSEQDGYLVVLHADPDGRVRVLYPLDPSDDDFIRGGKKFEVRGRGNRDAFQIEGTEASGGVVVAAVSPDAFKFDEFVRNDHWDFRALGGPSSSVKDDPLANLVDIVQRMSGGDSSGRFEYDQATYVVRSYRVADYDYYGYGYHPRYGIRFGFGYPYYSAFYDPFCDPFWGCYGGWGFGYRYNYGYYRPIYRHRPVVFANFGSRLARSPQFVFPRNRSVVTPVSARPRTIVPVESRRRDLEPRTSPPARTSVDPRTAPRDRRAEGPSVSQPRSRGGDRGGSGGSGGSARRSSGGSRPSSSGGRSGGSRSGGGGGGRRH